VDDPPPYPEPGDDTRTPRWVKVFAIVAIVLVLLFVIIHLAGGGLGGHTHGDHTPPSPITAHGVQQP
jgi:hypothetical protein